MRKYRTRKFYHKSPEATPRSVRAPLDTADPSDVGRPMPSISLPTPSPLFASSFRKLKTSDRVWNASACARMPVSHIAVSAVAPVVDGGYRRIGCRVESPSLSTTIWPKALREELGHCNMNVTLTTLLSAPMKIIKNFGESKVWFVMPHLRLGRANRRPHSKSGTHWFQLIYHILISAFRPPVSIESNTYSSCYY
jgi:hypothetical protein